MLSRGIMPEPPHRRAPSLCDSALSFAGPLGRRLGTSSSVRLRVLACICLPSNSAGACSFGQLRAGVAQRLGLGGPVTTRQSGVCCCATTTSVELTRKPTVREQAGFFSTVRPTRCL